MIASLLTTYFMLGSLVPWFLDSGSSSLVPWFQFWFLVLVPVSGFWFPVPVLILVRF